MSRTVPARAHSARTTLRHFEKALLVEKRQLEARIGDLQGDVLVDGEPEDEGGIAVQNYSKDWAAATLDRTRRVLREVEAALARIGAGNYGICGSCQVSIPKARLQALPWARLCVNCAERSS